MTQHTKERSAAAHFVLRVVGVAFASVVVFLLLTLLAGDAGTAEAATHPAGLGDMLGSEVPVGSALTPIVSSVVDVVAPVLPPITPPVTPPAGTPIPSVAPVSQVVSPVVAPVTEVLAPATDAVVRPVADTVRPVVPVVPPVADPVTDPVLQPVVDVATPVVEPVVPPGAGTVKPIADAVVPPVADTVHPPASEPATPNATPSTPGETNPLPDPAAELAIAPDVAPGTDADPLAVAVVVDVVPIDTPAPAVPRVHSAASSPASAKAAAPVASQSDIVGDSSVVRLRSLPFDDGRSTSGRGTRSDPLGPVPAGPGTPGVLPSIVNGSLSGSTSSAPSPGAPSALLAVLTATAAAMFMLSRRVTADVSWRSVLVFSSVERPG